MSDPDHARYGQHLSQKEVDDLVKPSDEALTAVYELLHNHAIPFEHEASDTIAYSLPVSSAEALLNTTYSLYKHDYGHEVLRTLSWSLPYDLHAHVATIQPTTFFSHPDSQSRAQTSSGLQPRRLEQLDERSSQTADSGISSVCDKNNLTPTCLRTLYGTIDYKLQAPDKNGIGVTEWLGDNVNRSDLTLVSLKSGPYDPSKRVANADIKTASGTTTGWMCTAQGRLH